jgi:hypothetical protein
MRAFLSSVKKVVVVHMRGRVRSLGRESVLRGLNEGPTASACLRAAKKASRARSSVTTGSSLASEAAAEVFSFAGGVVFGIWRQGPCS